MNQCGILKGIIINCEGKDFVFRNQQDADQAMALYFAPWIETFEEFEMELELNGIDYQLLINNYNNNFNKGFYIINSNFEELYHNDLVNETTQHDGRPITL